MAENFFDKDGLPADKAYLESGLPDFLIESIKQFVEGLQKHNQKDVQYYRFDCDYCNLQADINCAEVDQIISSEQAWYLREKYLGLSKGSID